jgi:hypothetical protein
MVSPSEEFLDLVRKRPRDLHRHMLQGEAPTTKDLVGREFRGANAFATARALGIRRFIKGFETSHDDTVIGYNRRVRGADLSTPWVPSQWRGSDRFGYFTVSTVDPEHPDHRHLNALLLDYGAGLNPPRDPSSLLRDYLVRTPSGVLLGHALVAAGRIRVPVGYFVLEPL